VAAAAISVIALMINSIIIIERMIEHKNLDEGSTSDYGYEHTHEH
jgi:hypothetical protein